MALTQPQLESFEPRHEAFHVQIAEKLQDHIIHQQLRPGERLPSERNLAKTFGVNRTTIAEAMNLLAQRGVIRKRPGSGSYVDCVPDAVIADSIERLFIFRECPHEHLLGLREGLEPQAAALAAAHATPDDLNRLKIIMRGLESMPTGDSPDFPELDVAFHETLATATHNDLISVISAGMHKVLRKWLIAQHSGQPDVHIATKFSLQSHRKIYDAVVARDIAAARAAMQEHIAIARRGNLFRVTAQPLGEAPKDAAKGYVSQ